MLLDGGIEYELSRTAAGMCYLDIGSNFAASEQTKTFHFAYAISQTMTM